MHGCTDAWMHAYRRGAHSMQVCSKASEGGGGKGIRMCKDRDEIVASFPQVANRADRSTVHRTRASALRDLWDQLLITKQG